MQLPESASHPLWGQSAGGALATGGRTICGKLVAHAGIGTIESSTYPCESRHAEPQEVAYVAGTDKFQSMSCLTQCGPSPRFVSIGWDKSVAWCSYTSSRTVYDR